MVQGRQLITCMCTKTALNGEPFRVDTRAPGPVRSPQMVLMLLGLHGARLSRKWSCPFFDFRIFLHDFHHARKKTKTRENPYFGGICSVGPHVKICTMNIDHIWAGHLLTLPSPGRQRPWKVILHIFDPLWLHCSADGVKRATELKSSQTKHVALAFWS